MEGLGPDQGLGQQGHAQGGVGDHHKPMAEINDAEGQVGQVHGGQRRPLAGAAATLENRAAGETKSQHGQGPEGWGRAAQQRRQQVGGGHHR